MVLPLEGEGAGKMLGVVREEDDFGKPIGTFTITEAQYRRMKLLTDLDGVHPTSERSIYNHYGFVAVTATATTCAGNTVTLDAQFNANQGELQMVDIQR